MVCITRTFTPEIIASSAWPSSSRSAPARRSSRPACPSRTSGLPSPAPSCRRTRRSSRGRTSAPPQRPPGPSSSSRRPRELARSRLGGQPPGLAVHVPAPRGRAVLVGEHVVVLALADPVARAAARLVLVPAQRAAVRALRLLEPKDGPAPLARRGCSRQVGPLVLAHLR